MNVSLTAHRLLTKLPTSVGNYTKKQKALASSVASFGMPTSIAIRYTGSGPVHFGSRRLWRISRVSAFPLTGARRHLPEIEGKAIGAQANVQPGVEASADRLVTRRQ